MLDMGFIHDIRRIVAKLPAKRQTLFFSATMPREITELANSMLKDPVRVAVTPAATTVERVDQRVIIVDRAGKPALLAQLLRSEPIDRVLVFTRTKHGADKVVRCARQRADRRRGHPRQQVAEPARARAGGLPGRQGAHAGRDRHRRARHRRRRHQPRRQLRPAEHPGELRPPHRPHRARRRRRRRDLVLRWRGARLPARHREADPHLDSGHRPARRPPCGAAGERERQRPCGMEPAASSRARAQQRSRTTGSSRTNRRSHAAACTTAQRTGASSRNSPTATAAQSARRSGQKQQPRNSISATVSNHQQRQRTSNTARRRKRPRRSIASVGFMQPTQRPATPCRRPRTPAGAITGWREGPCRRKTCSNSTAP